MASHVYYTAEMVRALPDDGSRYETVHGELLVTPAPRVVHQRIVVRLVRVLSDYLDRHPVGELLASPADISWSKETLVQPDLFVCDLEEARTLEWTNVQKLLLVIEVLSPSTAQRDRFTKRRLYQEVGIPAYWIVDPEERCVEVWAPDATAPAIERELVVWRPVGAAQPFKLDLEVLFRPM